MRTKEPIYEYFEIIVDRLQNPLPKGEYFEKHHIYPKSLGGWNLKCNLVKLTPEEHLRCHKLLVEIFRNEDENAFQKMTYALWMISHTRDGAELYEEEYGKLKRDYAAVNSAVLKGRTMTEERKRLQSENAKKQWERPGAKEEQSKRMKGRVFTEEHCKNLSKGVKESWSNRSEKRKSQLDELHRRQIGRKQSPETIAKRVATRKRNKLLKEQKQ